MTLLLHQALLSGGGSEPGNELLWEHLGDSLAGWLGSGSGAATVTVLPTDGSPEAPCLRAQPNQVGRTDTGVVLDGRSTIRWSMKVEAGSTNLADFRFGCTSAGTGPFFRADGRGAGFAGFAGNQSTWTSVADPTNMTGPFDDDVWIDYQVDLRADGLAVLSKDGAPIYVFPRPATPGTWLGVYGDGGTQGGRFDTFRIERRPDIPAGRYLRFRLVVTAQNGSTQVSIQEMELRESPDGTGPNVCTGQATNQAAASSQFHAPSGAFDGDTVTPSKSWTSGAGAAGPHWLEWRMMTGQTIRHARIMVERGNLTRGPVDFSFQASRDGATWDTLASYVGVTSWADGVWKEFSW